VAEPLKIRCRADLVAVARDGVKSRACRRALSTRAAVVLGGFSSIPPYDAAGWILTVVSKHARMWIVAVIPDDVKHNYRVVEIDKVPWLNWVGGNKAGELFEGDIPDAVRLAQGEERMKECQMP
jgi:hypothetical protein